MNINSLNNSALNNNALNNNALKGRCSRPAFTLLEVLLTLAMSVVLMGLIGSAIQFYARDMNVNDLDVRQTMLASAVIQMIEDDLRATVHTEEIDMSALEDLLAANAGSAPGEAGEQADGLDAAGIDLETDPLIETETADLTSGTAVLDIPGLIGNQYQIQLDISRLPRIEEYNTLLDGSIGNLDDIPSDIKTVTYYLQPAGAGGVEDPLNSISPSDDPNNGGLVRRSLDRAVTIYAANNGNLSQLSQTGEVLAPEVIGLEFQYWDGLTWQLQWNSDEYEELPLAVRIDLSMTNPVAIAGGMSPDDEGAIRTFMHIVRLPMAKPMSTEEEEEEAESGI